MSRDDECQRQIEQLQAEGRRRAQSKPKGLFDDALRRAERREQPNPVATEGLMARAAEAESSNPCAEASVQAAGRAAGKAVTKATVRAWRATGGSYDDRAAKAVQNDEAAAPPDGADTRQADDEHREREAMDAEGLARLQALETEGRRRCRTAPKSDFDCAVRRAERREVQSSDPAPKKRLLPCPSTLQEQDHAKPAPGTAAAAGRDPREDDPAFQNAPESEQARIRAAWAEEARAKARRHHRQHNLFRRTLMEATILFAILGLVVGSFLGVTVPLMCCGPAVGFLWHVTRADRIGHAWIGLFVYGAVVTPLIARQVLTGGAMLMAFFCLGGLLTGYVCAARGLREEMRAQEGF